MTDEEPSVEEIARQEEELVLDRFDEHDAWRLGSVLREMAAARALPVAIDIRRNGHQLFHAALPGSAPDNDAWVERKVRVVTRFGKSSLRVGAEARAKGTTFEQSSRLDPDLYAAHGGAFPIAIRGTGVVGVVTVSGLPQREDHALVVEALRQISAG